MESTPVVFHYGEEHLRVSNAPNNNAPKNAPNNNAPKNAPKNAPAHLTPDDEGPGSPR